MSLHFRTLLAACVVAMVGELASCAVAIDFAPVTEPIGQYVEGSPGVPGAGLLIVDFSGETLHEQYWGDYDRSTVLPIASASKWPSAAAVMTVVEGGALSLDTPASVVLPEFSGHPGAGATVRQMFSHTAGAPGRSIWLGAKNLTLAQSVGAIANAGDWEAAPGQQFNYGGVSMQIAGRMAEAAADEPWDDLFQTRVMEPLGVNDTDFQGLGPTTNPRVAGGVRSSIDSYERFLRMLANGGLYEGERVLSESAVDAMLTDQTAGAALEYAPPTLEEFFGYGVGSWVLRENEAGTPVEWASPGAFGTIPWIDLENQYYGVFVVDDALANVVPLIDDVRAFTREALGLAGDYNLDGVVDTIDLAIWREAYGFEGFSRADGNGDGRVDASDYTVWVDAASAATAIPEPSAAWLLLGAVGGGLSLWRR